jgi:kinesin family protein 4/21/27
MLLLDTLQKLAHITAASEEERKRIEAVYKDRLAAADEKLKALRHKEREFVQMQKLKHQTEVRAAVGCWSQCV